LEDDLSYSAVFFYSTEEMCEKLRESVRKVRAEGEGELTPVAVSAKMCLAFGCRYEWAVVIVKPDRDGSYAWAQLFENPALNDHIPHLVLHSISGKCQVFAYIVRGNL
jgi:hypothetical protein